MDISNFLNSNMFVFIILPILIFLIRIVDVSIGTIRIIFISRDIRFLSSVFGFFEVLIWLFAISQIMRNINSPIYYIAYAGGFAMGTFIGISIERKFSQGNRIIQIITSQDATQLIKNLRKTGHSFTSISGDGLYGPVKVIFTVLKKKKVEDIIKIIRQFNPNAFYTVEDVRFVKERFAYPTNSKKLLKAIGMLFQKRK